MPRPRFGIWILTPTEIVIDPLDSYELEVDQVDTFYPQYFFRSTWAQTAGTTGLSVAIHRGYVVNSNLDIEYTDEGDSVTMGSQPDPNDVDQVTRNDFAADPELYPQRIKFVITNDDTANPVSVFVAGDR